MGTNADLNAEQWSRLVFLEYRTFAPILGTVNRAYQGDLRRPGDTVHIAKFDSSNLTVKDNWVPASTPDSSLMTETAIQVLQQKSIFADVLDLESVQQNVDVLGEYTSGMGRELSRAAQLHLVNEVHASGASEVSSSGTSGSDVYVGIGELRQTLEESGVVFDEGNVFLAANPLLLRLMRTNSTIVDNSIRGDSQTAVADGAILNVHGFNVVPLPVNTTTSGSFAYDRRAVAFIMQNDIQFEAQRAISNAKFATTVGAKVLYQAAVLDTAGVRIVTATSA